MEAGPGDPGRRTAGDRRTCVGPLDPHDVRASCPFLGNVGNPDGVFDVERDDDGHDASRRDPVAPRFFEGIEGEGPSAGSLPEDRIFPPGIPCHLDGLQRIGDDRPMGAPYRRPPLSGTSRYESGSRRCAPPHRGYLPAVRVPGCLHGPLSFPVGIFPCLLERWTLRSVHDGIPARALLRGVLLGAHGPFLRVRRDESPLDGRAHGLPSGREGGIRRAADEQSRRLASERIRFVDAGKGAVVRVKSPPVAGRQGSLFSTSSTRIRRER